MLRPSSLCVLVQALLATPLAALSFGRTANLPRYAARCVNPALSSVGLLEGAFAPDAICAQLAAADEQVAGVYAILDANDVTRFVGISRHVAVALEAHMAAVPPEAMSTIRLQTFTTPRRTEMEALKREWIGELQYTPEGNNGRSNVWTEAVQTALDKLRSRASPGAAEVPTPAEGQVISPFDTPGAAAAAAAPSGAASGTEPSDLELTVANVDRVLDQVRPYLINDGGNVAVVSVDGTAMSVDLQLEGACGSCPSSTTTMKMGIERVLKEKWPRLTAVNEVGGAGSGEPPAPLNVETAEAALEVIMPAVTALGGTVTIESAETVDAVGVVALKYEGPDKIKLGLELALRDHPQIDEVIFK